MRMFKNDRKRTVPELRTAYKDLDSDKCVETVSCHLAEGGF